MLRENTVQSISDQLVDPAAAEVFLLVSATNSPVRGPWVLCRIGLPAGTVRQGPTFAAGGLIAASGDLWVYGAAAPGSRPVVIQVNPVTLRRIRLIRLPRLPAGFGGLPGTLTQGPAGPVWVGSYDTLLRVSAATGAVLARMALPAGLAVDNVSAGPDGADLYVSATHLVRGGMAGLVMLEYDARTGRMLAAASGGLLAYSVAGAELTAVPGGVWVSFRTGMLGLTIHLGARSLQMIEPPGPGVALGPPGVFHWAMYQTTAYGGGALWAANQDGLVACLDPQTGKIRAIERLPQSQLISPIEAIDSAAGVIFALQNGELAQITPPRRCWN